MLDSGTADSKRRQSGKPAEDSTSGDLPLEKALERLEEIARQLEGGSLDLELSLQRYREARELYGRCVARLSEAEREVRILMADGSLGSQDSDTAGGGGRGD
ncbi:MAG: exodeoxyribonuclease VII small subunit [Candidatus Eisenbacteria sp.]|nr:exodeoxyribonuclease VII small subunit [Candidatus Eisenbacteria bacterium]